jgi:hypothetical protein
VVDVDKPEPPEGTVAAAPAGESGEERWQRDMCGRPIAVLTLEACLAALKELDQHDTHMEAAEAGEDAEEHRARIRALLASLLTANKATADTPADQADLRRRLRAATGWDDEPKVEWACRACSATMSSQQIRCNCGCDMPGVPRAGAATMAPAEAVPPAPLQRQPPAAPATFGGIPISSLTLEQCRAALRTKEPSSEASDAEIAEAETLRARLEAIAAEEEQREREDTRKREEQRQQLARQSGCY